MAGKSNAGKNGGHLEHLINTTQALRGYTVLDTKQRKVLRAHGVGVASTINGGKPFVATNTTVFGIHSIYDVPWKLDVFLWHPTKMPNGFVMECKWQQTSGSTDDKLPFSVMSLAYIKQNTQVNTAALMLDGSGVRGAVEAWVRRETHKLNINYFTKGSEWAQWASNNL